MGKEQKQLMHADAPNLIDLNVKENFNGFLYEAFKDTPEGFLKGRAVVTNIGIFPYYVNGDIENRLRLPEDVMDPESLDSLRMVPLTNNHPAVAVDSENIKDYQIGHLGTDIRNDSYYVSADIIITDKETIEMVRDGKVALSCGYFSAIENDSGAKWGGTYDSKQTHIRYNHVAIVDAGRAGDDARMIVDSEDMYFCGKPALSKNKKPQDNIDINNDTNNKEIMMKIIVDNKSVEVEDVAANDILAVVTARDTALTAKGQLETANAKLKTDNEKLTADTATLEAELDTAKEALKTSEDSKKEFEASVDARIETEVKERSAVTAVAKTLEVKVEQGDSVATIKKNIVLAKASDKEAVTAKIESLGDTYIVARYDGIVENISDAEGNEQANAKVVLGADGKEKLEKPLTADEARRKSDDELINKTNKK